eukprot:TRINITY_DN4057_c0_g1_i1.p1 TRINITY_DN4057_c0_g1~~TRINITY_DN4057_c0_g1_i1.p1  ORF type:complete len:426 (-),score=109.31 TRINITY_DN4057_c0_g1_i1:1045-2322(-)
MGNNRSSTRQPPAQQAPVDLGDPSNVDVNHPDYSMKYSKIIRSDVRELMANRLVIDNGAEMIRLDASGSDAFARWRYSGRIVKELSTTGSGRVVHCGYAAEQRMHAQNVGDSPIHRGVVTNWDDMEKLWVHGLDKEMRCGFGSNSAVMTDSLSASAQDKQNMTRIAFEVLQFPVFSIWNQQHLAILYNQPSSGILVESGDSSTYIVPFHDRLIFKDKVVKIDFGGLDVTLDFMAAFQQSENLVLKDLGAMKWKLHDLKKNFAMVRNGELKENVPEDIKVEVSSGECVTIPGNAAYSSAEILFGGARSHANVSQPLPLQIWNCASTFSDDMKKLLMSNIVLVGGNTKLKGFEIRLEQELKDILSQNNLDWKLKMTATPGRDFDAWSAANHLISYNTEMQKNFFDQQEYDEVGPSIYHRKAFNIFTT